MNTTRPRTFKAGWFLTYHKKQFNLMEPSVDMIDPRDICRSLSLINRFNGHTARAYSVAEHSCRAVDFANRRGIHTPEILAEILVHDFAEAYYHDLMSPIKDMMKGDYETYYFKGQTVCNCKFLGYPLFKHPDVIKEIDDIMKITEARDIAEHEPWWDSRLEVPGFSLSREPHSPSFHWERVLNFSIRRLCKGHVA